MDLSLGIVGLPNVGKSTLFNALTASNIPAENYPFCTIEPNIGIVPVNDKRLDELAKIEKSKRTVPAIVKFVDIAGLVKGASKGEGLGNQFLSHIREVTAIVQVIRRFSDDNVMHVEKTIDAKRDIQTVEMELILKDIETLSKRINAYEKEARANKNLMPEYKYLQELLKHLNSGKRAIVFETPKEENIIKLRRELFLLTDKPMLYLVNEAQEKISSDLAAKIATELGIDSKEQIILMDVKLEAELALLSEKEQAELLKELGLSERPLYKLVRTSQKLLGLINFFTAGEKEARAWTIRRGDTIVDAAGTIHTDFANKFIAADVVSFDDFVEFRGWLKCKEAGKIRLEGKDYIVKDGDVVIIRHGA